MPLSLWIDPDDDNEVTLNGTKISAIGDKSSSGNDVTALSPEPESDLVEYTDLSPGKRILDCSNGGYLTRANASPILANMDGPDFTAVVAIRDFPTTSPINWSESVIFGMDGVASPLDETGWRIKTVGPSPEEYRIEGSVGDAATNVITLRAPSSPQSTFESFGDGIMTLRYDASQQCVTGFVNGAEVGSIQYTGTLGFGQPLKIGENFTLGRIYEVLYFDDALNSDDIQRAEGFIAHKWSIQDILPDDHPFRVVGPDKEFAGQLIANMEGIDNTASPPGYTAETGQSGSFIGNAHIDASKSALGYSSLALDGSGDYMSFLDSTDFELGGGDFTLECFVTFNSTPSGIRPMIAKWGTASAREYILGMNGTVLTLFWTTDGNGGTQATVTRSWSPATDTWYHVVCCRRSDRVRFWIDGVELGTEDTVTATFFAASSNLFIGANPGSSQWFNGNIDGVRLVKGTALYWQPRFSRPRRLLVSAPASAALIANFNGVDTAASPPAYTSEDAGARPMSFIANAQLDTALAKFGTGSLLLDGTGDYGLFSDSADFEIGAADFTVEAWVRWSSSPGSSSEAIVSKFEEIGSPIDQLEWQLDYENTKLRFGWTTNGAAGTYSSLVTAVSAFVPSVGTWYHVCAERSGGVLRLWVDGVLLAAATNSVTFFTGAAPLTIGGNDAASGQTFTGNIDSVRVLKGDAIYSAIRPLDRAFVADDVHPDDRLVADFEAANGISSPPGYAALTGQVFQWDGSAAISTTERRVGSSCLSTPGGSDGVVVASAGSFLQIGTADFAIEYWFRTTSPTIDQLHFDQRSTTTQVAPALYVSSSGTVVKYYVNGVDVITSTTVPTANVWMHVCLERINSETRLYINGVQEGSAYADSNNYVDNPVYLGKRFTSTQGLTGYMDQVRFRIGSVFYGGDFTPPAVPFGEPILDRRAR